MKILLLNYEFPPLGGGGGIFTRDLAGEFAKKHTVDIVTTYFRGLKMKESISNYTVYRVPVIGRTSLSTATMISMLTYPCLSLVKGIHLFLKKRYDIIHTNFAVPTGPTGLVLSRIFNTPNVVSFYGGDIHNPNKRISPEGNMLFRWAVRTVINNATESVSLSTSVRNLAIEVYHPTKDICVIPLGTSKPVFKPLSRRDLSMKEGKLYLIAIGRLLKTKGFDTLIRALGLVRKEGHDIHLVIIGEGPERDFLKNLAVELRLSDRIMFLGAIFGEKKYQYLLVCHFYSVFLFHNKWGPFYLSDIHYIFG